MTFTNPLFLIGLVAVAVPIVVHLFNFRRYKKVYFSNVDRLWQLQTETKRRSRLREYLILAARILAVVFLVLAFAQPFIPNSNQQLKKGGCAVSVYIDNSFSMENTNAEGTLLEMAKHKAAEIAAAYKPSDQFQLLTNDMEGAQFRWVSREEFLSLVDEMEPSSASPLLSSMAAKQHDFLNDCTMENRFAYVISDFQSSTADFENFPNDSAVTTMMVPLEAVAVDNFSIDSVTFAAPVFMRGSHVVANVHVSNHGEGAVDNMPLKLYVGGRERALSAVSLPGNGNMVVEMPFVVDEAGVLDCMVETSDYPVTFDDRYYFSLNIGSQLSMLEVKGSALKGDDFVDRLFDGDSLVVCHQASEQGIDYNALPDYNFIVLNELGSIPSGLAHSLQNFVEAGGSVLVVPSADADVDSYNQALRLFDAPQLGPLVRRQVKAGDVNRESGLYRGVFSGKDVDNVELPTLQCCYRLNATSGTVMEQAISLQSGDAYLTTTAYGNGKVYLFAAPLQSQYCDFGRQALFVPSVYNMALFSRPLGEFQTTIDNTSPVLLTARMETSEGNCRLTNADLTFELIPDVRQVAGRTYLYPHSQVKDAGNYHFQAGARQSSVVEGLSFNYSRRESDMRFLARNEVARQIKDHNLRSCSVVKNAEKPLDEYIRRQTEGRQLWRWCVILALLMLAAEVVLLRMPEKNNLSNS